MTEREVILITGTRKGIGRHLAEHYVRQGMLVEGCSREQPDWELENYTHHLVDVGDERQVTAMLRSIADRHGRLDALVNNAGIAFTNLVVLTPASSLDRIFKTNFQGTFLVCREGAKLMARRRYGRIVNLGSVAVPMRLAGEAIYAASKSAIVSLTQIMAREVADLGITCNVIAPGPIETDLIRSVPRQTMDRLVDQLVIRRFGTFDDVANVIDFFIDRRSGYVTGQVINLGGV